MNDKETKTFDTQAINDVTQTSGVIPASTVIAPQPTLVVPEINMKESAPIANQAIQSAQAQTEEQTNLQTLTEQRIVDQQKQFAEQESLAQTIGGGGDVLRNEFNRGQEVLRPIEKDIQDLNSLINQKTRSIQNQLLDEEGRVVPKAFVTGRQAIIQQRGAADIASLGALLDAKNGMLSNAQEKLNQSLQISQAVQKAEIGEKQARINLLKEITGVSQDEEQKEVDKLQAEAKKFEEERDAISSIALQAMQSGAGADEIQRITQSKSKDEAIGNATSLGRAAKLDAAFKNAQIGKIGFDMQQARNAVARAQAESNNLNFNPDSEFAIGSPENVVAWLSKSSNSDKNIDQAQREQITQGLRAVSSVEALNDILFDGKEPLSTGRVSGRWLNVKKAVQEEVTAKEFEALVIGLVPTAARGLFGEVGVLTDTDTERYKQLIGNTKNTQEENAAIQTILIDVAAKSIGTTLETAARSNQNVSGFTGRYIDVVERVENQKQMMENSLNTGTEDSTTTSSGFQISPTGTISIPGISREDILTPEDLITSINNKLDF